MKIGLHLANGNPAATAESITRLGLAAEAFGLDSVWVSDHVVIPAVIDDTKYPYGPPGTYTADNWQNYFEPFAVLAYLAGRTQRVELGTSVIVVPQRQPLVIAKQWATLDALCGGRTILGIGAGWMREEFAALGVDSFDRRGPATDEAIQIFRSVWSQPGDVTFRGQVYRFDAIRALPKPARPGGPPIWIGGHGRRSIRRAAELGDGWHAIRIGLDELHAHIATLRELLAHYGRRQEDVVVSIVLAAHAPGSATSSGESNEWELSGSAEQAAERLRAYQALGVDHVVLNALPRESVSAAIETIQWVARDVRPLVDA